MVRLPLRGCLLPVSLMLWTLLLCCSWPAGAGRLHRAGHHPLSVSDPARGSCVLGFGQILPVGHVCWFLDRCGDAPGPHMACVAWYKNLCFHGERFGSRRTNVECLEGRFDTYGTFGFDFTGNLTLGGESHAP